MRSVLRISIVMVTLFVSVLSSTADAQETMRVGYVGELLDENNSPITGVFPLTFSIYRDSASAEVLWAEQQFVAVFDGMYTVELGRERGIPLDWAGDARVLDVAIAGTGSIGRQPLVLTPWRAPGEVPLPMVSNENFVDLAGTAIRADRAGLADRCRTLSGQSVDDLDHYDELAARIAELRERVTRPTGNRIGSDPAVLPRVGGGGGTRYERTCPPGFVMSGARGGAGSLVDGFRLICTQLE
jgi:hypothetical protein